MVVPIVKSPSVERCYTTALWHPVWLPFWAEYDDYGGGENESGSLLQHFLETARDNLIEVGVGEDRYHDTAVSAADFTIERFFESVHNHRLLFSNYMGDESEVDFVMIRKDVIDKFKDDYVFRIYVGDNKGNSGNDNCYLEYKWVDIEKQIPQFAKDLHAELTAPEAYPGQASMRAFHTKTLAPRGNQHERHTGANIVATWLGFGNSGVSNFAMDDAKAALLDAVKANRNINVEVADLLTFRFVDHLYSELRKVWVPGCHEGSQQSDLAPYALLGNIYLEIAREDEHRLE